MPPHKDKNGCKYPINPDSHKFSYRSAHKIANDAGTSINTAGALKGGVQLLQGPAREALPRLADPDGLGNEERTKIVKCFTARCANGLDPRVQEPCRGLKNEPKTARNTLKSAIFGRFSPPRQLDS